MKAKLLFVSGILYAGICSAQIAFQTNGKFEFAGSLPVPQQYLAAPGQVSKSGDQYLLGLTSGDLDELVDLYSNLYSYDLKNSVLTYSTFKNLNLPSEIDKTRFYQCSSSAHEKVIVFVINDGGGWSDNDLGIAVKDSFGQYPAIYYLSELNDDVMSDAYPWLSEDALRIYYSRDFKLMYSERKSISGEFAPPVEVDFIGEVNLEVVSCWLTPDELRMYFIANNLVYRSLRNHKTDPFSFPELYTNEFKDFYFIAGLSFTPDRKNMFIYYSDESTEKILKYHLKKGKI